MEIHVRHDTLASLHAEPTRAIPSDCTVVHCVADEEATEIERAALRATLAPEERQRADNFGRPDLVRRYVRRRGILRIVLASYLGCAPAEVELAYGSHGKPTLGTRAAARPHFNLSHTGGLTVLAVRTGSPVGIDVERTERSAGIDAIARRWFTRSQIDLLAATAPERRAQLFYEMWTRREAVGKAYGTGLVGYEGPRARELVACCEDTDRVRTFSPLPGTVASVAVIPRRSSL